MSIYRGVYKDVTEILSSDHSGHGMTHVDRVHDMAMDFAVGEGANPEVVELAAWLHDVDDHKFVGKDAADKLINAREILRRNSVQKRVAKHVLGIIPSMGYNNYLEFKRPTSIEGKVVSDADMLDAIGSQGLIRVIEYNNSKGLPFFDPLVPPQLLTPDADEYRAMTNKHAVQHFFDKLLNIPDILMTEAGQKEGRARAKVMHHFLGELFREEKAEDWQIRLKEFLS